MTTTDRRDAYLNRCLGMIAEFGHMVQYVGGGGAGVANAPFAYTAGLYPSRGYELCMSSVGPDDARGILNHAAALLAEPGHPAPADGLPLNLGGDHHPRLRAVTSTADFSVCRALFGPAAPGAAWQIMAPDSHGIFPGHLGFNDDYAQRLM